MTTAEAGREAKKQLAELTGYPEVAVIGVSNADGEWVVTAEACERKGIPDTMDLLGEYELHLSDKGEVRNFMRLRMRKRGDARQ